MASWRITTMSLTIDLNSQQCAEAGPAVPGTSVGIVLVECLR